MDTDAEKILELLDSYAGVLPFSEKASPEAVSYTHLDVYKRQPLYPLVPAIDWCNGREA